MTNLARTGTPVEPESVARLMARTIHPGTTTHGGTEEELSWLRARQGRVTATMARELVRGGAAARQRIIRESFVPPAPIVGNRYFNRGHEREPEIAAWIASQFSIAANIALVGADGNDRFACTPDGVGEIDGELVLAEIKTSKFDLDPEGGHFPTTGYLEQMQWQMLVTGARRTLFVWEQHDDDWENGPNPIDLEPRFEWIYRDEELIERMIASADLMLAERDRQAATKLEGGDGEQPANLEIEQLALAVLDAREAAKLAEARLKAPWTRLLTLLSKVDTYAQRTGLSQVTWNTKVTERTEPDQDAALAAEIETAEGVIHGSDLFEHLQACEEIMRVKEAALQDTPEAKNLHAAMQTWNAHAAQHTRTVSTSKQSLTVTAPKAAKS